MRIANYNCELRIANCRSEIAHFDIRDPFSVPLHSTEAIVIGGHDLAEADRIVVFYTKTLGKVRAVAEGMRRIRTRFGGSLQLFTEGQLVYFERPNKTLHKVNEFSVVRSHQLLREDLDRIALASAAVEAVSLGAEEGGAFVRSVSPAGRGPGSPGDGGAARRGAPGVSAPPAPPARIPARSSRRACAAGAGPPTRRDRLSAPRTGG